MPIISINSNSVDVMKYSSTHSGCCVIASVSWHRACRSIMLHDITVHALKCHLGNYKYSHWSIHKVL